MKHPYILSFVVCAASHLVSASAFGVVAFTDDFESDHSANWAINSNVGTHATNFYFDYSTVGIPAAPNSGGSTRGMKLAANVSGGVFSGYSVSPIGQAFAGDYTLKFDLWQNTVGTFPVGGNGSTQLTGAGVGTAGGSAAFAGGSSIDGVYFMSSTDGGTAQDYRAYYPAPGPTPVIGTPVLAANGSLIYSATISGAIDSRNNTNPFYAAQGNVAPPTAQATLFPNQTGNTAVGTMAFKWHSIEIAKTAATVTWTVDGVLYATVPLDSTVGPLGGTNIFFAQADINATSSTDPNAGALLFGLIDNVVVTVVPEPSSLALCSLGLLALRRRRST
jgi:hypothetical protein